ncbi:hypothetical protein Mterra_02542 [Calidithermus terrae]|uniref:Uncharacterized protein n=1 Tax=Calidithermus terrae TaxID=1408545 RepID=A0A399EI53_9DEIN|nr:hypothetical protein Mterra_02542 [Calidithermus terrae]
MLTACPGGENTGLEISIPGIDGAVREISKATTVTLPTGVMATEENYVPGKFYDQVSPLFRYRKGLTPSGREATPGGVSVGRGGLEAPSGATAAVSQVASFEGINHFQHRFANNGNQFSVEPPDQALCVGNGFIFESVNTTLRVYGLDGTPKTNPIDLNTFYGYPDAIDRVNGNKVGPNVIDPVCHYDPETKRFFHVITTLHVDANGDFTGRNTLDVAVSKTSDPTKAWDIYYIPITNDASEGTPDHDCPQDACFGDYPHLGMDAYGLYITTNEFPLFDNGYMGVNVYAISKKALANGDAKIKMVEFFAPFNPATPPTPFTLIPAISPGTSFEKKFGGVEYLLSADADALFDDPSQASQLFAWAVVNTRALEAKMPQMRLIRSAVPVKPYSVPPRVEQKPGNFPLGQCINDTTTPVTVGGVTKTGCWNLLLTAEPAHDEVLPKIDASDARMQQVTFAAGRLWGALASGFSVNSATKVGVAYYILQPNLTKDAFTLSVVRDGYLTSGTAHLIYPALGVTAAGKGVMGFTLVGPNDHPSAAYATLDATAGAGPIVVAAAGQGPNDGFTGYKALTNNQPRPRWGDYGAAAVDGDTVWVANEYVAQTCTLAQWIADTSCGGTRSALANWSTRVTGVNTR